ncbi:MAG TPA: hypothetical protein VFF06_27370 [Polyangia bacterium]|nr:hypothetical protein [Polyangia bacterium]
MKRAPLFLIALVAIPANAAFANELNGLSSTSVIVGPDLAGGSGYAVAYRATATKIHVLGYDANDNRTCTTPGIVDATGIVTDVSTPTFALWNKAPYNGVLWFAGKVAAGWQLFLAFHQGTSACSGWSVVYQLASMPNGFNDTLTAAPSVVNDFDNNQYIFFADNYDGYIYWAQWGATVPGTWSTFQRVPGSLNLGADAIPSATLDVSRSRVVLAFPYLPVIAQNELSVPGNQYTGWTYQNFSAMNQNLYPGTACAGVASSDFWLVCGDASSGNYYAMDTNTLSPWRAVTANPPYPYALSLPSGGDVGGRKGVPMFAASGTEYSCCSGGICHCFSNSFEISQLSQLSWSPFVGPFAVN